MENVVVIVGPTASGKTKLAIELAKAGNGEIISADSMQIYKFMDIGTAKPDMDEREGIKHYLMDEVYPDEEFSVARFQELALKYIKEIISKGKLPIIVGGTGLYINSLIYNINFTETISDWELREKLKAEAEKNGNQYLYEKLKNVDPDAAARIHVNDLKRIIRALEVYEYTRKPISYHQKVSRLNPPEYNYIIIGLRMERERLYERINSRVDRMIKNGLVEEVKKLVEMGYDKNTVAMQGLGYKEILRYIRGEMTLDEVIYILKRDTRHYAKRQMTWFRKIPNIYWVDVDGKSEQEILKNVSDHIASYGIFL